MKKKKHKSSFSKIENKKKGFFLSVFSRLGKLINKMLQSRGISDLLAAEKKAQELIEDARKRKFVFKLFSSDLFNS
jgi:hypothetical protein